MSLNAWERQALDSIRDRLASSDPSLVARLSMFTRLASGEEMPAGEKIRPVPRQATLLSSANPGPPRRADKRAGMQRVMLLLWLVTTLALIAVALAYNRGGSQGTCTGSWATLCTGATTGSHSAPLMPAG
jgi:hypothetical protein